MDFDGLLLKLQGLPVFLLGPATQILKGAGIIVLTLVVVKVGSSIIKKIFEKQKSFKYPIDRKKLDTMSTLLTSVFKYCVYIVGLVTLLTDVVGLKSVLATAGIGGIAIGFGAQSLIKDIISGFFIVMEDQYVVGDLVTIEGLNGTVEHLELRVTKLRAFNGDLHVIPNGDIKKVTNHTRGDKAVIVDIPVTYLVNLEAAFKAAEKVCEEAAGSFEMLVEAPKVLGITDMGKDVMTLRIMAKAKANEHWEVERGIRKMIKEEFTRQGIEVGSKNIIVVSGGNTNA